MLVGAVPGCRQARTVSWLRHTRLLAQVEDLQADAGRAQVEDLHADAGRARDDTRRLQTQLDRHSTPPAELPATPADTPRRSRPRSD